MNAPRRRLRTRKGRRDALRPLALLLFVGTVPGLSVAQPTGVLQIHDTLHELLQRSYTAGRLPDAQVGGLPYSALEAREYLRLLVERRSELSPLNNALIDRYTGQRTAKDPGLPLYTNGDLYAASGENFLIAINPMSRLAFGRYSREAEETVSGRYWRYRRGVRVSGIVSDRWFFESRVEEVKETVIDPDLIRNATIPRHRITRFTPAGVESEDGTANYIEDQTTWDYGPTSSVVGFRTGRTEIRVGRDRYKLGYGLNSVFLSNYASEYDHVLLTTAFWRIRYSYILASMRDKSNPEHDAGADQKTALFQRLDVALGHRVNAEAFQSVVVASDPAFPTSKSFDLGMLNPILFLRQFEKDFDGFGNKLIGVGLQVKTSRKSRTYGQFLMDEFVRSELFSGNGFWANKRAWLVGVDVAEPRDLPLRLQLEYAQARPYTYSHRQTSTNYAHYDDVLAHPAGSNFRDLTAQIVYRVTSRLTLRSILYYTRRGANTESENYGADPRDSYFGRISDFGVELLQGLKEEVFAGDTFLSYELAPNVSIDLMGRYSRTSLEGSPTRTASLIFAGLRAGLPPGYTRN